MLSQRQVVLFPVADLVNGLTYLVLTRLEQGGTKGKTKDALEY